MVANKIDEYFADAKAQITSKTGARSKSIFDHTALVKKMSVDKYGKISIIIEESPLKDRGVEIIVNILLQTLRSMLKTALDKRLEYSKVLE